MCPRRQTASPRRWRRRGCLVDLGLDQGEAGGSVRWIELERPAVGLGGLVVLAVDLEDLAHGHVHERVLEVEGRGAELRLVDRLAPVLLGVGGDQGEPDGGEGLTELVVDLGRALGGGHRIGRPLELEEDERQTRLGQGRLGIELDRLA